MRYKKYVQYKSLFSGFRKMPRDVARKLALADYDKALIKGDGLKENINLRLKGATIDEFLHERDIAQRVKQAQN